MIALVFGVALVAVLVLTILTGFLAGLAFLLFH
jgi:hypothetical protein